MIELKIGEKVEMEYGGYAVVKKILGSGGQGIVYLVDFNGVEYALKWYDVDKIKNARAFRKNIENNIKDGAPSDKFLWPKYLTKENSNKKISIEQSIDLKKIEEIAISQYGMQRLDKNQTVYVKVVQDDYGEVVSDRDNDNKIKSYFVRK